LSAVGIANGADRNQNVTSEAGKEVKGVALRTCLRTPSVFLGHFWATFSVVVGCGESQLKNPAVAKTLKNH
jgi:hypothetical protein